MGISDAEAYAIQDMEYSYGERNTDADRIDKMAPEYRIKQELDPNMQG